MIIEIILEFIFTPILEIKIHGKISWNKNNFIFEEK